MAKQPSWLRPLSEVLGHSTTTIMRKSARTGNNYNADVIPSIELVSMGAPQVVEKSGVKSYRYSVFDMAKDLEYQVTCPNLLQISGVKQVVFTNLTGGALNNGNGWYKADRVELAKKRK